MQFDLKKALSGARVKTIDGRDVLIAGHNPEAEDFEQILGWIKEDDGFYSQSWYSNGTTVSQKENADDLIIEKTK